MEEHVLLLKGCRHPAIAACCYTGWSCKVKDGSGVGLQWPALGEHVLDLSDRCFPCQGPTNHLFSSNKARSCSGSCINSQLCALQRLPSSMFLLVFWNLPFFMIPQDHGRWSIHRFPQCFGVEFSWAQGLPFIHLKPVVSHSQIHVRIFRSIISY